MSYTSNFNLNWRVSYLESEIAKLEPIPVGGYNLANVLTIGNNAGANDIDVNNNDILQVNNINLQTVNGTPYPPISPSSSLFNYQATTNSQAPPISSGRIKWNNATQASSTQLFVSHQDSGGNDIEVLLKNITAGYKIIIQDAGNSTNYQEWLVSNTAVVPNNYVTYTVSLVTATHSFGNNNQILLITQAGSASQTLSQVLATGNSAGGYSIDLNGNNITNINTLQGSSAVGVDLNISSTNNITMSADNINLGTSEIIYPTLATPNNVRIKASGQIVLNNATLNGVPLSVNNVNNAGICFAEMYNQRGAVGGETDRLSFFAKNLAGGKLEYSRISTSCSGITLGAERGDLELRVKDAGGVSSYIALNGSANTVNIYRSTFLNGNGISNVGTLTASSVQATAVTAQDVFTPTGIYYLKGVNEYYNLPSYNSPTVIEDKLRWVGVNLGKSPNWVQATSINPFGSGVENITASWYPFAGAWWVGTESGNVYYSSDGGVTWTLFFAFGGRINCFQDYGSSSFLAVGGQFTGTYNYLAGISSGYTLFDLTGSGGLNGEVKCFYDNNINGCLYIGGSFDAFFGASGQSFKFYTYDYNTSSFYQFNNIVGAGFIGGDVFSITRDGNSGFIIVGGSFTDESTGGGSINIPYLFTFQTTLGYDVNSFFSIGLTLGNAVYSVKTYSSGVIVGGAFNNVFSPSWSDSFGFYMTWNGSSWDLNNYPFFSPPNIITNIVNITPTGEYFTIITGNTLYKGSTLTPAIPIGSLWNCITYNGSITLYATNDQTSAGFLFYQLDQSVGVNIVASGGQTFNTDGGSNFTNCYMTNVNSSFEMIYRQATNNWYVISRNSCNFS